MIEKVKKILKNDECIECAESLHLWNTSRTCIDCKALKICQLFEPKPDEGLTYTLTCDFCGLSFYSREAFPTPPVCSRCNRNPVYKEGVK